MYAPKDFTDIKAHAKSIQLKQSPMVLKQENSFFPKIDTNKEFKYEKSLIENDTSKLTQGSNQEKEFKKSLKGIK